MKYYNQRNYPFTTLGFGTTTIASHGCFLTSLAMMVGKTPPTVNTLLKQAGAFSGDLIISDKAAEALGLDYLGVSSVPAAWEPSIMEVDMSPAPGKQQHFVVWFKDKIADPWTGTERPLNTYPPVSYRLFKNLSTNMNKDFVKEVSKICGEDYGDNINDNEQKDAAKKLKKYRENFNSEEFKAIEDKIKQVIKQNETLQKVITDLRETHKKEIAELIEEQQEEIDIIKSNSNGEIKDGLAYRWDGEKFRLVEPEPGILEKAFKYIADIFWSSKPK